eukprot:TRINITY_DN2995_c0_g1_i2.p1 TRINITY_DN2995_c0_g1~~TRINITY_DN2995_c0_g1_i2.p1  ORF type:complete len:156 (+),score=21.96 TRINITY_DN2995_c0_g1_i2:2-469(+)
MEVTRLADLPGTMIGEIISHLDAKSLLSFSSTSHHHREIVRSSTVWEGMEELMDLNDEDEAPCFDPWYHWKKAKRSNKFKQQMITEAYRLVAPPRQWYCEVVQDRWRFETLCDVFDLGGIQAIVVCNLRTEVSCLLQDSTAGDMPPRCAGLKISF